MPTVAAARLLTNNGSVALSNLTASRSTTRLRMPGRALLASAALLGTLIVGAGAEWLDFRALRVPILLVVGLCARAAPAPFPKRGGLRDMLRTSLIGAATWGAGGLLYVTIHVARGESFDAARFGAQWSQSLGLIG